LCEKYADQAKAAESNQFATAMRTIEESLQREVQRADQMVERQKKAQRLQRLLEKHKEIGEILQLMRELGV
jgi:hypothetical protein